jgi:hypothetical protein
MRGTITVTAAKASEDAAETPVEEKKAKPNAKGSYGSYGYSY